MGLNIDTVYVVTVSGLGYFALQIDKEMSFGKPEMWTSVKSMMFKRDFHLPPIYGQVRIS